jgi:Raf kinase inhibitor-like YbhB/YbcL family protein
MKNLVSLVSALCALTSLAACSTRECSPEHASSTTETAGSEEHLALRDPTEAPETITVTIGGLDAGRFANAQVFSGFGCTGDNRSPELSWTAGPEGTQSYAIIMHDPDAPTGVGFFHWIVLDVPVGTTHFAENETLAAPIVQGHTDFGTSTYGGPCPPPGTPHRYEITVYALDVPSVGLTSDASGALARFAIRSHTLAIGRATATYGR